MPVRISKNRVALENIPLNLAAEADVASAATCNIGAALSNNVRITGTTTITAFDTVAAGIFRFIRFAGALTLTHNSTTLKLPGSANITTSADDRAIARSFGSGNWEVFDYTKSSGEAVVGSGNTYNLTNIIYPRADGDWRGIYRGGWRPSFFNQQWGGAQWGNLPDGSFGDVATGFIDDGGPLYVGHSAATATYKTTGFKVSENITPSGFWVKLYKIGNPTDNFQATIYSDNGSGKPNASLMTALALSGKLITSSTNGAWYYISGTTVALTAGTQYHLVFNRSGAIDGANYYSLKAAGSSYGNTAKYPHGLQNYADGTPTWTTDTTTYGTCFFIPNSSSTKFLQSSGQFSGKLVFAEGSPLDQSKGLSQPLKNFFDGYEFTYRGVFTTLTKDKTIADFLYGLDHDRVVLRCNATTGYMQVDVYEQDGTKHTVTGTTDCSSGTKDIAIYIRAKGDGSDTVKLYVNGTSEGTPVSSATITFDTNFKDLGTAWLGGGFPVAPTWTKDTAMGSLPSADGWTWTGTGTEANCMSVSGGKMYQNYNGFGSSDSGYYARAATLSNANGWAVEWKVKVDKATNVTNNGGVSVDIKDGSKAVFVYMHEYFLEMSQLSTAIRVQMPLNDREHTYLAVGKGSDFFLFVDGKLVVDGTGSMTTTSATNEITFGDDTAAGGVNGGGVWDYIKDYNTAWLPPQFTAGSCSEAAFFSGDRTGILASLYNGGTLKSVREYCGVEREYISNTKYDFFLRGVTSNPTTTATSATLLPDMEGFILADDVETSIQALNFNSLATNWMPLYSYIDGVVIAQAQSFGPNANGNSPMTLIGRLKTFMGLHKVEGRWAAGANTGTSDGTNRRLTIEG